MPHLHNAISPLSIILLIVLLTNLTPAKGSDRIKGARSGLPELTETYVDKSYGFSIDLLTDFRLSSEQGDLLFFRSYDRAGTVIVRPRPGLALSTVQATLRNGFDNDVIVLKPTGAPTKLELDGGQGLAMDVEGTIEGREVYGMVAGIFGRNDQGYSILVGSVRERWPGFKHAALIMLESFSVQPVRPGYEHERWEHRLNGTRLVYAEGYGTRYWGGAYIGEYHFCSDGTFRQGTTSMNTDSNGWSRYTSSTSSKTRGSWQIQFEENNPLLQMRHKRGQVEYIDITEKEGYIFLRGVPYQHGVNELCK